MLFGMFGTPCAMMQHTVFLKSERLHNYTIWHLVCCQPTLFAIDSAAFTATATYIASFDITTLYSESLLCGVMLIVMTIMYYSHVQSYMPHV